MVLAFSAMALLAGACASPETPGGTVPAPAVAAPASPPAPAAAAPTPVAARKSGAASEAVIAQVQRSFQGDEVVDAIALLRGAEALPDDEQRFQAYLGAWQLMRRAYHQQGRSPEQKDALDAVERLAEGYGSYSKDLFRIEK